MGHSTAVIKTFTVNVTDGTLNIAFSRGTRDNPTLAGIEVWTVAP